MLKRSPRCSRGVDYIGRVRGESISMPRWLIAIARWIEARGGPILAPELTPVCSEKYCPGPADYRCSGSRTRRSLESWGAIRAASATSHPVTALARWMSVTRRSSVSVSRRHLSAPAPVAASNTAHPSWRSPLAMSSRTNQSSSTAKAVRPMKGSLINVFYQPTRDEGFDLKTRYRRDRSELIGRRRVTAVRGCFSSRCNGTTRAGFV